MYVDYIYCPHCGYEFWDIFVGFSRATANDDWYIPIIIAMMIGIFAQIVVKKLVRLRLMNKMKADKQKPWYWICSGNSEDSIGFSCNEALRSKWEAQYTIIKRNLTRKEEGVWYIKERAEHPDRDYKQFQCPNCQNLMSENELDDTWNWAGPHCNACGCTGMEMFAGVTEHAPVVSYKKGM